MKTVGVLFRAGMAPGDVDVAIDPAELEGLDEDGIKALYEERLAQQRLASTREVTLPPHAPFYVVLDSADFHHGRHRKSKLCMDLFAEFHFLDHTSAVAVGKDA